MVAAGKKKKMGRFKVETELANFGDMDAVLRGDLTADKVRRVKIAGIVDSGASRLVIPSAIAKQLGLRVSGKGKVKYADGRTARRDQVEGVYLELMGRHGVFNASLEPKRETLLIGAIVLEDLDFLIDPRKERLYPRDPEMVVSEIE
jgi:predicted aspartyl protease